MYDGHILDMIEFGVDQKVSISEFDGAKKGIGSKPIILFLGDQWENDSLYARIQNLLLDLFRGDRAEKLSLKGVDHVMACTCVDGKVLIRGYTIAYQKSESKVSRICSHMSIRCTVISLHCDNCIAQVPILSLDPMGPFYDLSVRRTQLASEDMWKVACKKPKT